MNPITYPKYIISVPSIVISGFTIFSFIFSLVIAPLYYDGDQIYYTEAYRAVKNVNLIEGFFMYRAQVSSQEPIHFFIVWLFSNLGVQKSLVMALANAMLTNVVMRLLIKWRVLIIIIIAVVIFNFYLLVLFFSAERLKFSFLFFFSSILFVEKKKKSLFLAMLSIATHVQISLMIIANSFGNFMIGFSNFVKTKRFKFKIGRVITILFFLLIFLYLRDHIFSKFSSYSEVSESKGLLQNIWQPVIFLLLSLLYSNNKWQTVFIFSIIILSASMVGSERVTMMAYFYFMFYALRHKRGMNMGVLLSIFYFGIKSIFFLANIVKYGHGF